MPLPGSKVPDYDSVVNRSIPSVVTRGRYEDAAHHFYPPDSPAYSRLSHPFQELPGNHIAFPMDNTTLEMKTLRSWHTYTLSSPGALKIAMNLNVPSFGLVFMTPTEQAKLAAQTTGTLPLYEQTLSGSFEVTLPLNVPRLRYKRVTVGLESIANWSKATSRAAETDVLFRREDVLREGSQEGYVIDGKEE